MTEFLQGYGILILIGLFFSFMLWRRIRGHGGMGCCGGGHLHEPETMKQDDRSDHRSGGCH